MSKKKFWIFIVSTLSIALIVFALIKTTDFATQYRYEQTIKSFQNGDFTRFIESESVNRADLQNAYKVGESQKNNEFVQYDINKDGIDELVWREKDELKGGMKRILGIFAYQENSIKSIFWDVNDSTEFFFMSSNGNIVYYIWDSGIYTSEGYYQYEIDKAYKWSMILGICIYNIYDLSELTTEMWNGNLPDSTGIYYSKYIPEPDKTLPGHMENISREEFLEIFLQITGDEFADSEHIFE